ncbi:MAG: GTP-binding protein, partial [Acidilobaceae archaeon]
MKLASWRTIARLVRDSDIIVEVVDIRDPISTMSKKLERMVEAFDKKFLIVLNKCDLVPRGVAEGWKSYLEGLGYKAMYVSATSRLGTRIL